MEGGPDSALGTAGGKGGSSSQVSQRTHPSQHGEGRADRQRPGAQTGAQV